MFEREGGLGSGGKGKGGRRVRALSSSLLSCPSPEKSSGRPPSNRTPQATVSRRVIQPQLAHTHPRAALIALRLQVVAEQVFSEPLSHFQPTQSKLPKNSSISSSVLGPTLRFYPQPKFPLSTPASPRLRPHLPAVVPPPARPRPLQTGLQRGSIREEEQVRAGRGKQPRRPLQ